MGGKVARAQDVAGTADWTRDEAARADRRAGTTDWVRGIGGCKMRRVDDSDCMNGGKVARCVVGNAAAEAGTLARCQSRWWERRIGHEAKPRRCAEIARWAANEYDDSNLKYCKCKAMKVLLVLH
jgi:hypothetical protein